LLHHGSGFSRVVTGAAEGQEQRRQRSRRAHALPVTQAAREQEESYTLNSGDEGNAAAIGGNGNAVDFVARYQRAISVASCNASDDCIVKRPAFSSKRPPRTRKIASGCSFDPGSIPEARIAGKRSASARRRPPTRDEIPK
jgi:hypothetical protein